MNYINNIFSGSNSIYNYDPKYLTNYLDPGNSIFKDPHSLKKYGKREKGLEKIIEREYNGFSDSKYFYRSIPDEKDAIFSYELILDPEGRGILFDPRSDLPGASLDEDKLQLIADYFAFVGKKSAVPISRMREEPEITVLDGLKSFSIMGLDLKITPDGEVKVIEVNGLHAGTKGFKISGTAYADFHPEAEEREYPSKMIRERLNMYGSAQLAYLSFELFRHGLYPHRIPGADTLLVMDAIKLPSGKRAIDYLHPDFRERYGEVARNLFAANLLMGDKLVTDKAFDGMRQFKSKSYIFNEKGARLFLEEVNPEIVVVKRRVGARGNGVKIGTKDWFAKMEPKGDEYLVEEFMPSIPILSDDTGRMHDGCMRYMVMVEEDKEGNVDVRNLGGYWRLCPQPFKRRFWSNDLTYKGQNSSKANLSSGALAQKPLQEHVEKVEEAVANFVPYFHRQSIDTGNNYTG